MGPKEQTGDSGAHRLEKLEIIAAHHHRRFNRTFNQKHLHFLFFHKTLLKKKRNTHLRYLISKEEKTKKYYCHLEINFIHYIYEFTCVFYMI